MASHTKSIIRQDKIPKVQTFLMILAAMTLVMFSFMLALKVGIILYPFNEEQQLVVDHIYSPEEYSQIVIQAGASQQEISHLNDVHKLVALLDLFIIPELLLALLLLAVTSKLAVGSLKRTLIVSGVGGLTLSVLMTISTILFFEFSFEMFHKVFFPQGNYQFAFDSYLISTLPSSLFFKIGILVLLLVITVNMFYLISGLLIRDN